MADRLARRYGGRPSGWILCDDPLALAIDLASLEVGMDIDASIVKRGAIPAVVVGG